MLTGLVKSNAYTNRLSFLGASYTYVLLPVDPRHCWETSNAFGVGSHHTSGTHSREVDIMIETMADGEQKGRKWYQSVQYVK
jgi:hypothetical protein